MWYNCPIKEKEDCFDGAYQKDADNEYLGYSQEVF